jgi:hypothetical protein
VADEAVDSDGTSAASSQASATTKSASSGGGTCTVSQDTPGVELWYGEPRNFMLRIDAKY